jgi:4-amino-4-deoxychorismate lyase
MLLVNNSPSELVSAQDRGLTLGDGLFTTLHLKNHRPVLWQYHVARLQEGCARLKLPLPDLALLHEQCCQLAKNYDEACGKIIITRGSGGRGYSPQGCNSPTVIVSAHPYPIHYHNWQFDGINLDVAEQRLGCQPMLAGLKTLNRLEQVLLKNELDERGIPEAIVLDWQDHVVEAVTANIFWRKDAQIFTPDLKLAGVCGVMRAFTIHQLNNWQYDVKLVSTGLPELLDADEVWITNALMGVVPVTGIRNVKYQDHRFAKQLQNALAALA